MSDKILNKVIDMKNRYSLTGISDTSYKDDMKYYKKFKSTLTKYNINDLNEKTSVRINKSYECKYEYMVNVEIQYTKDDEELEIVRIYPNHFLSLQFDFYKMIQQKEHTKKELYRFWKWFISDFCVMKEVLKIEYDREPVKIRKGDNRFIVGLIPQKVLIVDYFTMCYSKKLYKEGEFNIHKCMLSDVLQEDTDITYTPYTHTIEPILFAQFAEDFGDFEYYGGHTHIFIKPIGYYTFHNGRNTPTNYQSVYFDTNGITHTKKHFILYELYDNLIQNHSLLEEQFYKYSMSNEMDNLLHETITISNNKKKRKKTKKKLKKKYEDEIHELIETIIESEPIYEEPIVIQPQIEEEEVPEIIIREIPPTPPIRISYDVCVEQRKLLNDLIRGAIHNKSNFYELVKDSETIFVKSSIHNSFHKTERYNHFNIKLSSDMRPTYHIYTDTINILYFTKLTFVYE